MEKQPHTQLADWLYDEGRKQTWLASRLGVSTAAVRSWLRAHKTPQPGHRARLEAITGIPADLWGMGE